MKSIVRLLYPCSILFQRQTSFFLKEHVVSPLFLNQKTLCQKCRRKLLTKSKPVRKSSVFNLSSFVEDDNGFEAKFSEATKSLARDTNLNLEDENVFIIQPIDYGDPGKVTTAKLELAESMALVESLPNWKVSGHFMETKQPNMPLFFKTQTFDVLANRIKMLPQVSSIFVSVEQLAPDERAMFRKLCDVDKVYDRYTLVLQIFKIRAQTKSAKLQVALAEIPYARRHLVHGISSGDPPERQKQGFVAESYQQQMKNLFQHKEKKLRKQLQLLTRNRELHRRERERTSIPVVAVVGYTNAGKTSLIKALSKSKKMEPKDQLFATLDVTAHAAQFPNKLRYIMVDTVGFLSNLPLELFDAFSATMEDMLCADVIVHVRDESHPDRRNQLKNVISILSKLNLKSNLLRNIVEVRNKIDLTVDSDNVSGSLPTVVWPKAKKINLERGQKDMRPAAICRVSATRGLGLSTLIDVLQDVVMVVTARRRVEMLVPADGGHLDWLQSNASVEEVCGEGDFQLRLRAIVTQAQLDKFLHAFNYVEITKEFSREKIS